MIGADFRAALVALPPEDQTAIYLSSIATLQNSMLAFSRGELDERTFIVIAQEVNSVLAVISDDANGVSALTSAYAPFAIQADAALAARLVELDA